MCEIGIFKENVKKATEKFRKVRLKRTNFWKGTHTLPRTDRDWPRLVPTEIVQLSGGNVCVNLGFLKKT